MGSTRCYHEEVSKLTGRCVDCHALLGMFDAIPTEPSELKATNPKEAIGTRKVPYSCLPAGPIAETALAFLEGACKYGRHNYREAGVRASTYYDAAKRHLDLWWEGQNTDPDSGLPHLAKAMACLFVLRDAQINDMCEDDRPPPMRDQNWLVKLNKTAGEILDRFPEKKPAVTALSQRTRINLSEKENAT